ncbi:MAG: winged helix-turn-helix transcriptional regulator [Crenarchaeota archaeon]|nr:winged helix-turn-helix transcriptional regulator [Thermoproteota archaeon]MCR8455587.1 winged helix-turn-helix transcriptional regulator [Thermoproteota archaeon]
MSLNSAEAQIYRLLLESGPLTADLLARILGLSSDVVNSTLDEMIKKGYIARFDDGRFFALPRLTESLEFINVLKEELKKIEEKLKESFHELREQISESHAKFADLLVSRTDSAVRSIHNMLDEVIEIYKGAASKNLEAIQSLKDTVEKILDILNENIKSLETLQEAMHTAVENLEKKLSQTTEESVLSLLSTSKSEIEHIKTDFTKTMASIHETFERCIKHLHDTYTSNLVVIKDFVKEAIAVLSDMVLSVRNAVEKAMSEVSDKLKLTGETKLDELVHLLSEIINEEFAELERAIETYRSTTVTQIKNAISKQDELLSLLRMNIAETIKKIGPKFDEVCAVSEQNMWKQLDEILNHITMKISYQKDLFSGDLASLDSTITSTMESIKKPIINSLDNLIDAASSETSKVLSTWTKEFKQSIGELSNAYASILVSVGNVIKDLDAQVESSVKEIDDGINRLIEHFRDRLRKTHNALSKNIQKAIKELSKPQVKKSIEEKVIETINPLIEKLNSELSSLFVKFIDDIKEDLKKSLFSEFEKGEAQASSATEGSEEKRPEFSSEYIASVKDRLFMELEDDKKRIKDTMKDLLTTYGSNFSSILTDHIMLLIESFKQQLTSQISDTETLLKDNILWLDSEVCGELKLLLSYVNKCFHEFQNIVSNQLTLISSNLEKNMGGGLRALDNSIAGLQAGFDNYRETLESMINNRKDEIDGMFKDGTTVIKTAVNNCLREIESGMKSLSDFVNARKGALLEAINGSLNDIKMKFKAGLAASSEGASWEIDNTSKTLLDILQGVHKNVDENYSRYRDLLQGLSESTRKAVMEAISSKITLTVSELTSFISNKEAETLDVITRMHENTHNYVINKISRIDEVASKVDSETSNIKNEFEDSSKQVEKQTIQLYDSYAEKISGAIESMRNMLLQEIASDTNALKSKSQEIFKNYDQGLKTIRETLRDKISSAHQETVNIISKSIDEASTKIKEQSRMLETHITSARDELKALLEREELDIRERTDEILTGVASKAGRVVEWSDKVASSILNAIQQYASEIKSRPKGVFIYYGREVLNTLLQSMIDSARRYVLIITPVIDEALEKILLESSNKQAIIEIYTGLGEKRVIGNAFVATMTHVPEGVTVVVKDDKESVILLEKDSAYIGAIFEDVDLSKLLSALRRQQ